MTRAGGTDIMTNEELFQRNLDVFERHFPDLHRRIKTMTPPLSEIVRQDGIAVDIHLQSGQLYKQDARTLAQQQVDSFVAAPLQLNYAIPTHSCFDSSISNRVFNSMMRALRTHSVDSLSLNATVSCGYLVVLGLGLGHHIPLLLDRLPTRHVIIVEPFEEFLFHSLHTIDWTAILDYCERTGRTLHVGCERHVESMYSFVCQVFESYNPTLLDGTYIISHYPLWELVETRRRIINELPRRMVAMGYFEDERKMLCNAATNLHRRDFRLLEGRIRERRSTPVFLVGAGPSFDHTVEFIRQWRDYAIIISSGSALPLLIEHGIIPDFHTELENGPKQYDKTMHVLERFPETFPDGKFTGIRLIGSTTLAPRVAPLFDEVYFFFRDSVTSTTTFGRDCVPLRGAAPTVANTSLVSAACLGFGDIYLFGFDCAWRDDKEHHAKGTVYYTSEMFKKAEMQGTYLLPGNFGGQVQSEIVLDWSRNMLQQCLRAYHLRRVFNCSDGAVIEGTIPKVAEALDFAQPIDRDAVLGHIREQCPHYPAGSFLKSVDLGPAYQELRGYVDALCALIDHYSAEDRDFADFLEQAWKLTRDVGADRRVVGLISFTTVGELKQAALFINRVLDPTLRRKVARDFLQDFRALHQELLDQSVTILDEISGVLADRLDPEWATIGPPD